jgi:uncharacterized membrane protein (UPF0127 family)
VAAIALIGLVACGSPEAEPATYEPLVTFETTAATIETATDTIRLTIEIADTDARKRNGLMERPELPEHQGMIFTYDGRQSGDQPFWMYRTLLPLDIAFLDDTGRIVAILSMDPCESPNPDVCRRYAPGVPYHAALEVGEGLFEAWGVAVGDRVVVSRDPGDSSD